MIDKKSNMVQIGVYGGAFDPIHYGHVFAVTYLSTLGKFDKVLVLPVGKHAHGKELVPHHLRYEMCTLALGHIQNTQVSDIEQILLDLPDHPSVNYTYHTLKKIKELHPTWNLHFVVGADVGSQIQDWYLGKELLSIAQPYILGRHGYEHDGLAVLPDISSTEIRESFKNDPSHRVAKEYLPKPVYQFVIENDLYKND